MEQVAAVRRTAHRHILERGRSRHSCEVQHSSLDERLHGRGERALWGQRRQRLIQNRKRAARELHVDRMAGNLWYPDAENNCGSGKAGNGEFYLQSEVRRRISRIAKPHNKHDGFEASRRGGWQVRPEGEASWRSSLRSPSS